MNVVDKKDLSSITQALYFLKMGELRLLCEHLALPDTGVKKVLIGRILHFLETGNIRMEAQIPAISRAQRGHQYSLHLDMLIVKGAYKNDLATRLFFKKLIGEHFHFTAFGIDWIKERWMAGNPPTYQEFADMWDAEYARRKTDKFAPKREWAYINFIQKFIESHPEASRAVQLRAWKYEHDRQVVILESILGIIVSI